MALFSKTMLTRGGKNLVAYCHTKNVGIHFTKIKTGDGTWDTDEDLEEATSLKGAKQEFEITSIEKPYDSEAYIDIIAVINNKGLQKLYYLRELGLYAMDPQTNAEILYAILYSDNALYIPEDNGVGVSVITENITIEVANASSVTIESDGAIVSAALYRGLKKMVDLINEGIQGGEAGSTLVKLSGDEYNYGWVKQIYVGKRETFPEKGYGQGIYVDTDSSAIYVWSETENDYVQLPLGAEASEALQIQITKNRNDINALKKKNEETNVTVPASGWESSVEEGVTVYKQDIALSWMTKNTESDVLPNLISTSADAITKEQDAAALFFLRGVSESNDGKLQLTCYKKKPAVDFGLILRGK